MQSIGKVSLYFDNNFVLFFFFLILPALYRAVYLRTNIIVNLLMTFLIIYQKNLPVFDNTKTHTFFNAERAPHGVMELYGNVCD